jgi:predicted GNAT family acetyltransferase
MDDIQLILNEHQRGGFYIQDAGTPLGKMEIGISDKKLTVYHTEVDPSAEGKGLAKQLLAAMVAYARQNQLQVIPLCPFVNAQFRRHPDEYADIWYKPSA